MDGCARCLRGDLRDIIMAPVKVVFLLRGSVLLRGYKKR